MSQLPERAEQLFAQALSLPPAERPGFLAHACEGDRELLRRVEALLRGHADATFLESSAVTDLEDKLIGTRIGRYKLLEKLGEGGSGTVYLAEQEEPIRRRVALKIIKAGMDTREVITRFEAERQILAVMDHPNIARVYDCGATEAGRPYFVMELVQGTPITRYCDDRRLSVPERLELFVSVCRAIQHAHEKGIVHRDIKPSNVLVTVYDGAPSAKVIDFGVAKATETRLSGRTVFTSAAQFIGTPAYMSPEQADLGTIDARSDVYCLGVLLYELLSGFTPFDGSELTSAGLEGMRRRLREEDPPRPSERLAAADPSTQAALAERRGLKPPELAGLLRRELDGIVMHCIERDSGRRYATAVALSTDVTAYLRHEPAATRSNGPRGRPRPRRSRWVWGAVAASLLVLMGDGLLRWKPWQRSAGSPAASPAIPDEAAVLIARVRGLYSNLNYGPADLALAEKFMARATDLAPDSSEAWGLRGYIQGTYVQRGWDYREQRLQDAQSFCNRALALDPNQVEAVLGLGYVLFDQEANDQAEAIVRRAIQVHPDEVRLRRLLGVVVAQGGRTAEGIGLLEDTARRFPQDPLAWYDLGWISLIHSRVAEGLDAMKHVVSLYPVAGAYLFIARILGEEGDFAGADAAFSRVPLASRSADRAVSVAMWLGILEHKPDRTIASAALTATTYFNDFWFDGPKAILAAMAYQMAGKKALAGEQCDEAERILRERLKDEPRDSDRLLLATVLVWKGQPAEAAAVAAPVEAAEREAPSPMPMALARYYAARGDADAALPLIKRIVATNPGRLNPRLLRLDPSWDPIRSDPRFLALAGGDDAVSAPGSAVALNPSPVPPEAAALMARTRKLLENLNYGRADLALAEKFAARATDLAPDSAEAWALRGYLQAIYVQRTWDHGENRLRDAQAYSQQALALDPDQAEAMLALAIVLDAQGAGGQAEATLRRALQLRSDDPRLWRLLGVVVFESGRRAEGLKILEDTVRRFPRDPLCWYELSRLDHFAGRRKEELEAMRRATQLYPLSGAFTRIAWILAGEGDLAGAEAAYDRVPLEARTEDRAVGLAMFLGNLERKPDKVIAAAGLTTNDYFEDNYFRGPKAFLSALAYKIAGKPVLEEQQWDEAARVLRGRLEKKPEDEDRLLLAVALAWRGKTVEAAALIGPIEAAQSEGAHPSWAIRLAQYHAGLGDAPKAVAFLRSYRISNAPPYMGNAFGPYLLTDPSWDKIRDTPEFKAFAAETKVAEQR